MGILDAPGPGAALLKMGRHDDGLEGAILTKVAQGALRKVPFSQGLISATNGTSNQSLNAGINPDGSGTTWQLSVVAGVGGYAFIQQTFWGRVIGIRFRRLAAVAPDLTVIVDGVIYRVSTLGNRSTLGIGAGSDYEGLAIVASDLTDDGPHTIQILLTGDTSLTGAVTRSVTLFGLLVEAEKGYERFAPRSILLQATTTVPLTSTSVTSHFSTTAPLGAALIRRLYFSNTDAASRTVTIFKGSIPLKVITLATATSDYFDFGGGIHGADLNYISTGANVAVIAQTEGIYA